MMNCISRPSGHSRILSVRSGVTSFVLLFVIISNLTGWRMSASRDATALGASQQCLASVLQADGSLRAGVAGSFDVSGYRMELTAAGAPRFVPGGAGCETADWDGQFALANGTNHEVDALAVMGNAIYVGGEFTAAGNVAANRVAKFDTTTNTWSALSQGNGNGVNSDVDALAVSGNSVFVVGGFTTANLGGTGATPAITANRVAKFDTATNTWSALSQGDGNGVDGSVIALAVSGNSLFVGGFFTAANQGGTGATPGINANFVAKFDTMANTWSALSQGDGNGVDNGVGALAMSGDSLFVGGSFATANQGGTGATPAITANRLAKFDTMTNTWSALSQGNGNGVNDAVNALAVSGNSLFVVGAFLTANQGGTGATPALTANRVAKFDITTSTWSALSQGNGNGVNSTVRTLAVSGNSVFIGGTFTTANQGGTGATPAITTNRVAEFDTTTNTWSALSQGDGNGVNSGVRELLVSGDSLFVGGGSTTVTANQGGTGATPAITANRVAKFDTMANTWSALSQGDGNGVNDAVNALAVSGNSLFVGGSFTFVGNVAANRVAKFDTMTNTWSALSQGDGNGVNSEVRALAVSDNKLFVGGSFTTANQGGTGATPAITANRLAKFDTTTNTWSALSQGNGNGVNNQVSALVLSGNSLFVGGFSFTMANQGGTGATPAIPANRVAKFDTTTNTWSALLQGNGNGVNDAVNALAVSGNSLFVGGFFTTANQGGTGATPAIPANNVAKFDTMANTWSTLSQGNGNGVDNGVSALAMGGDSLFVGGFFTTANLGGTGATPAITANRAVKFDTMANTWTALAGSGGGNGVDDGAGALAVKDCDLFVGGDFSFADNNVSQNIARYGPPNNPSDAKLEWCTASGYDAGVLVQWQTGYEANNLGFNVYREQSGSRQLINQQMIAGSALVAGSGVVMRAGRSYGWWDKLAKGTQATYWLEDVDINGKSTLHGPFTVKSIGGAPPARSQAVLLSQIGEAQPIITVSPALSLIQKPQSEGASSEQSDSQASLASGLAVKLGVREDGWYRVAQGELIAAGLDPRVDPRYLQLFLDGVEQALLVTGESDGRFDPDDAIELYGKGLDAPSSDTHVYWLVIGKQLGKRVNNIPSHGNPGGAQSFSSTVERKERSIYFTGLLNGEEENFFGRVVASQPVDQSLPLQHLDTSSSAAVVEVALQGVTDVEASPDHQVSVALNGSIVGRMIFDSREHKVERFLVHATQLREGENTVTLTGQGGSDVTLVDYVRISYNHTYAVDNNELKLTASMANGPSQTIEGFSTPLIRVIDVTDPSDVQEIAGRIEARKGRGFAVTVDVAGDDRSLIAFTDGQIKRPAITANIPSNWRGASNGADMLIITQRELAANLEPLRTLRQSQGLSVAVIDVEDIYDEFSFGEKTSQSLKDFIGYAVTSWKKKPRFVLLAGDASYDPKNYLGLGGFDFVPTKLLDTAYMETASDDWFADFDNDGVPELAVGRLPFRNAAEASTMIAKIIGYERSSPSEEVLLVADNNEGFGFEGASSQLVETIPASLKVNQINRRADTKAAKARLMEAINRGQKIVNYMGHGSVNNWRGNLLVNEDADHMNNTDHLSVFVMMTCLNSYFDDPSRDSLAESLLKAERAGAVAVWASSGMTLPGDQARMNQALYKSIFSGKRSPLLGDAVREAKAASRDVDIRRTWVLLGDPSMRVR